jgi:AcrR family transcriptional regulator
MRTLTPVDWFDAALGLLAEGGAEQLTLAALCERVGATKGSFYHHFENLPAFHERALAYWSNDLLERAVATANAEPDPRRRLGVLRRIGVSSHHEAEIAIRAWGTWYAPAAAAHRRLEEGRRAALVATFAELGIDAPQAARLARIGTALMMGLQHQDDPVDRAVLDDVFAEYQRWIEASIPAR